MPYYGRDEPVLADSRPGSKDATHLLPLQQHQCVTRPKIWTIPIPRLFFGTKFFRDRFRDFFRYQNFLRPIPRLFFGTNFFWDRFRDFFRYQIFSRPVPRLFSVPNFFDSGSDTIKKNEEFPGTGIPGTGTSHSGGRNPLTYSIL